MKELYKIKIVKTKNNETLICEFAELRHLLYLCYEKNKSDHNILWLKYDRHLRELRQCREFDTWPVDPCDVRVLAAI